MLLDSNALCARHPERAALATCDRCGDYACGECIGVAAKLCARCIEPGTDRLLSEHSRHARSIRALGFFYLVLSLVTAALCVMKVMRPYDLPAPATLPLLGLSCVLLGIPGWGLFTLSPWSRIPGAIVSFLGLFSLLTNAPLSGLISAYGLYLLLSTRGAVVLSERYRAAVALDRERR